MLHPGASEKFLIVDHLKEDQSERDFKRQIIDGILDLPKKPPKTREASTIGSQLNIIALLEY